MKIQKNLNFTKLMTAFNYMKRYLNKTLICPLDKTIVNYAENLYF